MVQTIIGKAKELIESVGKDEAIKFFEDKISKLGKPKDFEELCIMSGWETAIDFIKGEI